MNHFQIIRDASEFVYNQLGFGFSEETYRKALSAELLNHYNQVEQEYTIPKYFVTSKGTRYLVTTLRLDILINTGEELIILELKTKTKGLDADSKEYRQLLNYQRILNTPINYLINFSKEGLQIL